VFRHEGIDVLRHIRGGHAFAFGSRGGRERGGYWGLDLDGQFLTCNHVELMNGYRKRG